MTPLEKAWREALKRCPCCQWELRESNTRDDGIPEPNIAEFVYTCGAAVFLDDKTEVSTSRACGNIMDERLDHIGENVQDAADADEEASHEAA